MKKLYSKFLLTVIFVNSLNAINTCELRSGADLLDFKKPYYTCNADFYENELLDLDELTFIEDLGKKGGMNSPKVYKDKLGNVWFVKCSNVFGEYVGGHILKLLLGNDRIAEIKLIRGDPSLIASKKLENFESLRTLAKDPSLGIDPINVYSSNGIRILDSNEDLLVGMNYVGLEDRHHGNQGYIKRNDKLEAARVDYDFSFKSNKFDNEALFRGHIDYGKLEKAIIELLSLPDDQIHHVLEKGIHLKFLKEESLYDSFITNDCPASCYLEKRKNNFKQLLPLITCLKKILSEGDMSYLKENKDVLIAFQNTNELDSGLSYLNILMHQLVQRGCLEALKMLQELEFYEHSKNGYGFDKQELVEVAYEAKQDEVFGYLLEKELADNKTSLEDDSLYNNFLKGLESLFSGNENEKRRLYPLLRKSLSNRDYSLARRLIKGGVHLYPDADSHDSSPILKEAIGFNDLNFVKELVELGASVKKEQVLRFALDANSSLEIFQYLLENGAGHWLSIDTRLTSQASLKGREDVAELLVQYGGDLSVSPY